MPTAETIGLVRDVSSSQADVNNGHPIQDESSFAEVLNGISALVACLRPDGRVETVNHHVLDYFGKTLEELKEWSSTDAVHPDDLPRVLAVSKRSFESGEPYDVELRQRRADGVYRWFHAQGLPVRDAEGHRVPCRRGHETTFRCRQPKFVGALRRLGRQPRSVAS